MRRSGVTLLELVAVVAMLGTLMAAVGSLIRSAQAAYLDQTENQRRVADAHGGLRSLLRRVRQATAVTAITSAGDSAGSLSVTSAAGRTFVWARVGDELRFGEDSADETLAAHITAFHLTGYDSDGAATTTPEEIAAVEATLHYGLDVDAGATRQLRIRAWLRSAL